jgi:peptidoglycan/LPS O-acetylase OafA/YrhL
LLGNLIHRYETVIIQRVTYFYCKIFFTLGIGIGFIEWFLVGRQELYIGSIIVVCVVFIYALSHEDKKKESCITFIGEKYSLFIYIVHISVGVLSNKIIFYLPFYNKNIYNIYQYLKPFIVVLLSSLMAWVFYKLIQFISTFNLIEGKKNKQLINKE